MRCVSLGHDKAVVEHVAPNDVPHGLVLTGEPAQGCKDWVMNWSRQWLSEEARRSGSYRIVRAPAE